MTKVYWLFLILCLFCLVGIGLAMFHKACLKPSDGATLFAGLLAATIVWWQGHLIRQQMQLQAIIDLDKEWNSGAMLRKRRSAWSDQSEANKYRIEGALEFSRKSQHA